MPCALKRDDMTAELLNLWHLCGQTEKATAVLVSRKFHPWEGGEGKVTSQFILNQLLQAWQAIDAHQPARAEMLLIAALRYPENLSEGRLPGQTDNDIWFWLGVCARLQRDETQAQIAWQKATQGDRTLNVHSYYNDQPADYLFWQGMALRMLGDNAAADVLFTDMTQWAANMVHAQVGADFFAVSQPDLLSLYGSLQQQHQEKCLYIQALAAAGMGDESEWNQASAALTKLNPAWPKAALFERVMPYVLHLIH